MPKKKPTRRRRSPPRQPRIFRQVVERKELYQLLLNTVEPFWLSDGEIHPNDDEVKARLFPTTGEFWLHMASGYQDMSNTDNWPYWDGTLTRTAISLLFNTWKNGRGIRQNAKPCVWRLDTGALQSQMGWCRDCGGNP